MREHVFQRDVGRCRYCGLKQLGQGAVFHINHILPRSKGGRTDEDNLALQCPYCSSFDVDRLFLASLRLDSCACLTCGARWDEDAASGEFRGLLRAEHGRPLVIEGLWALRFGNGAGAGPATSLFFTAGIDDEAHGLFGTLTPLNDAPGDDDNDNNDNGQDQNDGNGQGQDGGHQGQG